MFFENKNQKPNKKSGVTLIESLIVLSIAVVLITSYVQWFVKNNHETAIKKLGNDISKVMYSAMRRIEHDGPSYDLWEGTYSTTTIKPSQYSKDVHMGWKDNKEFVDSFLKKFLIAHKHPHCPGSWNPLNDNATLDGGTETDSEKSAFIPCSLWKTKIPFNLNFSATITNSPTEDQISDIVLYMDITKSSIWNRNNVNNPNGNDFHGVIQLKNGIENNFKKELLGSQYVEFVNKGTNINDPEDDNVFTNIQCLEELKNGRSCLIRYRLDTTDATNGKLLRVDGSNDMRNPISFSENGVQKQKCAHWTKSGSAWTSSKVDCGLWGGASSPSVESVTDNVYSENVYISIMDDSSSTPIQYLCKNYKTTGARGNEYLSNVDSTTGSTPCGIFYDKNGKNVVQLITDEAFIGTVYAEDIVTQDIRSNSISLKYDPKFDVNLLEIEGEGGKKVMTIYKNGDMKIGDPTNPVNNLEFNSNSSNFSGEVIVGDGFTAKGNSYFELNNNGELVQIKVNNGANQGNFDISNIPFYDGRGNIDSEASTKHKFNSLEGKQYLGISAKGLSASIDGFGISSDKSLALQANEDVSIYAKDDVAITADDKIYLDGNTILTGDNKIYSNRSTNRELTVEDISGNNINNLISSNNAVADDFSLVTKDYVDHIKNLNSKIVLRGIKSVGSGNSKLNKPDCFDFITDGGANINNIYYQSKIYKEVALPSGSYYNKGYDFAKIVLVPTWFKTYNESFGDNQAYTHHAMHAGNTWEIYQYLSGEGISGLGAREDGAGGSLALIYCDYTNLQHLL